jgi:ADP-ribose pyrophosphatase YjhB (NUDIX family)
MTQILFGERIGREGKIRLGCAAVLFDENRQKVLLTRRVDTGQWCLPSGGVEPGESVIEACERETLEETGLQVRVVRLTSICSNENRLVIYEDGGRFQIISLAFEVMSIGGDLGLSNETTDAQYYAVDEINRLDLFEHHRQFIQDALAGQDAAFIR